MAEVLGKPVAAGDAEGGARSLGKAPCASWPRHRPAPMARRERGGFGQGGSPAPLARCSLPCPPKCKIRRAESRYQRPEFGAPVEVYGSSVGISPITAAEKSFV